MKILQINVGTYFRGSEKIELEWFKAINKKIKFDFITPNKSFERYKNEIKKLDGKVYDYNYKMNSLKEKISYFKKIKTIIKKNQYDIIHINTSAFFTSFIIALIAKKCKCKKIIVHSHNNNKEKIKGIKKIMFHILNPLYIKITSERLTCSKEAIQSLLTQKNIKNNKYKIIKNGININDYKFNINERNEYINKLKLNNKTIYGHIGGFDKNKNQTFLIDIFNEIQKKQDSILILIGEGKLEEKIKQKVKKMNLEKKVLFLGYQKEVNKILNCIDIFIFPSYNEGLGLAAIEAQTNGIITYCSKGIPKEAKISPFFRYFDLSEKLEDITSKILNEKIDITKRNNAYKYTIKNKYDIKSTIKQLEKIYKNN